MKTLIKILCLNVFIAYTLSEELNAIEIEYLCTVEDFTTKSRSDSYFIKSNLKKIFVLNFKKDTVQVTQICTDCISKKNESIYKIISKEWNGIIAFELTDKVDYKGIKTTQIDYGDALTFYHDDKVGTITLMNPTYTNTWFLDCEVTE